MSVRNTVNNAQPCQSEILKCLTLSVRNAQPCLSGMFDFVCQERSTLSVHLECLDLSVRNAQPCRSEMI